MPRSCHWIISPWGTEERTVSTQDFKQKESKGLRTPQLMPIPSTTMGLSSKNNGTPSFLVSLSTCTRDVWTQPWGHSAVSLQHCHLPTQPLIQGCCMEQAAPWWTLLGRLPACSPAECEKIQRALGCTAPSQAKKRRELFHWDPLHSYNTSSAPILYTSFTRFHQQLVAVWAWLQSNNFEVY